jgi:hypothetical protein
VTQLENVLFVRFVVEDPVGRRTHGAHVLGTERRRGAPPAAPA